ncbi:2OG-Fe(II) oxygenase [Streptomyces tubercidicus]|uniref:2OG-Fe(II) oxygenase n=1 Tax=Streptomyces tubercidicus TaxID=47759 RepID=UPI00367B3518
MTPTTTTTARTTTTTERHARPGTLAQRVAAADWPALAEELDTLGCAVTPRLLGAADCRALSALYDEPAEAQGTESGGRSRFRSTIDMARHRFGSGQYRYFANPLPEPVQALREAFYPHLLKTARDRPVRSARGWSAGPVRHGVSTVRSGRRHSLGLVFHDA